MAAEPRKPAHRESRYRDAGGAAAGTLTPPIPPKPADRQRSRSAQAEPTPALSCVEANRSASGTVSDTRVAPVFVGRGSLSETPVTNAFWSADLEAAVAVENLTVDPCTLVAEKKTDEVRGVVGRAETPRGGGADA